MKSTELRIGNLVIRNGLIVTCDFMSITDCYRFPDQYKPIPLTEEWLLKFGLLKNNEYPFNFLLGFIKIRNGVYFFKYHQMEVNLEYVHQLQNLYHALTGQELTIKG